VKQLRIFGFGSIFDGLSKRRQSECDVSCALVCFRNPKSKTCPEPSRKIENIKWLGLSLLTFMVVLTGAVAQGQQAKVFHIGVIHQGGPYEAVVGGLRFGLRE
jgi:hypothetical protein